MTRSTGGISLILFLALNAIMASEGPALGHPVATTPSLPGRWVIKDVRFGNGTTVYQPATPGQKQQLLGRVGGTLQVASNCGQGGPAPITERNFIPHSDFARPASGHVKRMLSLGVASRGQGVWQLSQTCGNVIAGTYLWSPGNSQIIGGHNINDMIDYEFVLERASAAADRA